MALLAKLSLELGEERLDPTLFDLRDRGAVDPGGAAVYAHLQPRPLQHIPRWMRSQSAWNRLPGDRLAVR